MAADSIKAFSDPKYDYYRLEENIGIVKKGAIFYHDPDDNIHGSEANGCLKLCWTPEGNCYSGLCGGTITFHTDFIHSGIFSKAKGIKPERFEIGRIYRHTDGRTIKIIGAADTYRYGIALIAEDLKTSEIYPVGDRPENMNNFVDITYQYTGD